MSASKLKIVIRDMALALMCLVVVATGGADWYRLFWLGISAICTMLTVIDFNTDDEDES